MRDLASLRSRLIKMEKKFGLERFCFGSREFRRKLFFFGEKHERPKTREFVTFFLSLCLSLSLFPSLSLFLFLTVTRACRQVDKV